VTEHDAALARVAQALRTAAHVTVLSGAGMSAESGIPTFRDALTGLWARFRPEELATPEAFARQPRLVWDWYAGRRESVLAAAPNAGHDALLSLERRVPRCTILTQNVDGLHQRAGSARVIELHGNITRVRCAADASHDTDAWGDADATGTPTCPRCGARLRPDVVWFGEALPPQALETAWAESQRCDLFLSVGTSNLVEPAASLPWIAAEAGALVAVVNPDMSGQRRAANIVPLVGSAATILPALVAAAFPGA
jgi:NAD-dependent deacetylase